MGGLQAIFLMSLPVLQSLVTRQHITDWTECYESAAAHATTAYAASFPVEIKWPPHFPRPDNCVLRMKNSSPAEMTPSDAKDGYLTAKHLRACVATSLYMCQHILHCPNNPPAACTAYSLLLPCICTESIDSLRNPSRNRTWCPPLFGSVAGSITRDYIIKAIFLQTVCSNDHVRAKQKIWNK